MKTLVRTPLLALLLCIAVATAASTEQIAIGPYVQNVTTNEATICWATLDGEASLVGPDGASLSARAYAHHQVIVQGLEPNTEYSYNVPGGGASTGGTFKTAPEPSTPFTFVAFGDTRSRHDVHRRIVEGMMAHNPDFVLNTGDLVSNGRRLADWETFFEVSGDLMRTTPYYAAIGNHENDSLYYFDFFALPGDERNYSFDWGGAHIICLDPEGPDWQRPQGFPYGEIGRNAGSYEDYLQQMLAFLRADLEENNDAPFIFVAFHYPPYSAKATRLEDAQQVREFFGSIFADYRVTAVLNGHDHYYMRAVADGVTYVVTGGGGAPLYDPDMPPPEAVSVHKIEHFVRVDVQPPTDAAAGLASFTTYDIDGNVIDSWTTGSR